MSKKTRMDTELTVIRGMVAPYRVIEDFEIKVLDHIGATGLPDAVDSTTDSQHNNQKYTVSYKKGGHIWILWDHSDPVTYSAVNKYVKVIGDKDYPGPASYDYLLKRDILNKFARLERVSAGLEKITVLVRGEEKEVWKHTYTRFYDKKVSVLYTYKMTPEESSRFKGKRTRHTPDIIASGRVKRLRSRIASLQDKRTNIPNTRQNLFGKIKKIFSFSKLLESEFVCVIGRFETKKHTQSIKYYRNLVAMTDGYVKLIESYMGRFQALDLSFKKEECPYIGKSNLFAVEVSNSGLIKMFAPSHMCRACSTTGKFEYFLKAMTEMRTFFQSKVEESEQALTWLGEPYE